jgi:hypothetical protein
VAKKKPKSDLRTHHKAGKEAIAVRARRIRRGEGVHGTLAALEATTAKKKNRLMQARRFAALYDSQQLDALCALGKKKGRPLTWFHVVQLIRVADRRQRKVLARQCAEGSWSVRRLEMEVRRLIGRRTYGGRKHEPPQSVDEALRVTERLAAGWIRWVSVLKVGKDTASKKRITLNKLPKPIREQLAAIREKAEELREEIAKKLNRQSSKPRRRSRRRTL